MLIKVTAIGLKDNVATTFYPEPKTVLLNSFKMVSVVPISEGKTEVRMDEFGKTIYYIKETPEEVYELSKKEYESNIS